MRIGYSVTGNTKECQRLKEEGKCDRVVIGSEPDTLAHFLEFLSGYPHTQIVVVNVESLGLALTHYDKIAQVVNEYRCDLHFMEKELEDDHLYLHVLEGLAKRDYVMMSQRTHRGLEKAKEKGHIGGRPHIDPEVIQKIQMLHYRKKKSLREISAECGVSLGTVYKYKKEWDDLLKRSES